MILFIVELLAYVGVLDVFVRPPKKVSVDATHDSFWVVTILVCEVVWDDSPALHKYILSWIRGIVFILNDELRS